MRTNWLPFPGRVRSKPAVNLDHFLIYNIISEMLGNVKSINYMKVNNINGTSENTCNCGSWLNHWKNYSGQSLPTYCLEKSCTKKPEVGAHVQKDSADDKSWYIIPLCSECNRKTRVSLDISDSIALVSANISQTCD